MAPARARPICRCPAAAGDAIAGAERSAELDRFDGVVAGFSAGGLERAPSPVRSMRREELRDLARNGSVLAGDSGSAECCPAAASWEKPPGVHVPRQGRLSRFTAPRRYRCGRVE